MQDRHQAPAGELNLQRPAIGREPLTTQAGDPPTDPQHRFKRGGSHQQQQRRIEQPDLLQQPGPAGIQLDRARAAIGWGAALDRIGDVEIKMAVETRLLQELLQQLAGATHEGLAGAILIRSWRLPDQKQPRGGVAAPEHHLLTTCRQVAAPALTADPGEGVELGDPIHAAAAMQGHRAALWFPPEPFAA